MDYSKEEIKEIVEKFSIIIESGALNKIEKSWWGKVDSFLGTYYQNNMLVSDWTTSNEIDSNIYKFRQETQHYSRINTEYRRLLQEMLLHEKIELKDIPIDLRIYEHYFYVMGFRVCRTDFEKTCEYLKIFKNDILYIHNTGKKADLKRLIEMFINNTDYSKGYFKDKANVFEGFDKEAYNIYERLDK